MHPYKRSDRVGHLIQHEINDIVMNRIKDPRLGFLTITGVRLTRDLRQASVFVSVYKEAERAPTMEALQAAEGFVRAELRHRLAMKIIPEVRFVHDTTPEYGDRMERLFKGLVAEGGMGEPGGDAPEGAPRD